MTIVSYLSFSCSKALKPDQPMVRFRAALCLMEVGEDKKALRELRHAKRLDPDLPQVGQYIERVRRRKPATGGVL